MERVESKHLFNYQLNGVPDAEVTQIYEQTSQQMFADPTAKATFDLVNSDDTDVDPNLVAGFVRGYMSAVYGQVSAAYTSYTEQCEHTNLTVPPRDGNNVEVPVLVHTPKPLLSQRSNAAVVYAHGGGGVGGTAAMMKGPLSRLAVHTGVVYFNVDYRLAPETKCPNNALDFYCAIKHVKENAVELGVDPERIAIAGDSGGGYVCFAAMVMLAQRNEGSLVKLAIPGIPMIDDLCFTDPTSMPKEERESAHMMRKLWKCIADDFEAQRSNPLLFPAKATDDLIAKMPPTIMWCYEMDMYITESTRMARRMQRLGRLLEFRVHPGLIHAAFDIPGTEAQEDMLRDYKLALDEYLL